MSSAPLNITVSIGDVSFHLSPHPPNDGDPQSSPSNSESPSSSPPEREVAGWAAVVAGDGGSDRYFVDLSSFTGTLRIARSSLPSTPPLPPPPPPSGLTAPPSLEGDSWGNRSEIPIKYLTDDGGGRDARPNKDDRSPALVKEKSVRFSVANRGDADATITPTTTRSSTSSGQRTEKDETSTDPPSISSTASLADPTSSFGDDRRNTTAAAAASSSTSVDFAARSPPKPRGFSLSPPRTKFAAIAHHVLNQVTLAGKDVVDALDSRSPGKRVGRGDKVGESSLRCGSRYAEDDDYDCYDGDAHGGTELHRACVSDGLDLVRAMLLRQDDDLEDELYKPDHRGRLPIHVLSMNRRLIGKDPDGCEEVALALIERMGPEKAVQALHPSCGLAPFVYVVGLWTERLHSSYGSVTSKGDANDPPAIPLRSDEDNACTLMTSAASMSTIKNQPRRRVSRVPYRSLFSSSSPNESSVSSTTRAKLLYLPASVTITDHEIFAIRMLSRMIDNYPERTREAILTNIASVPLFLKSVLLINDPEKMTELINSTLVKHVVMDKRSINVWLCAMLTDTKDVKMRAASFIKLISRLTFQDLASSSQSPDRYSDNEIERFATNRKETFNALYCWPGIVPAVLELGGQTIENLSSTRVMRYITDRCILNDRVFFILALDFFLSMFILMGFRLNVELLLRGVGADYEEEQTYIYYGTSGVAGYFLFKEMMTLLSLYLTSTKLVKRYCLSVFNIINVASVAMLIGTGHALAEDPAFVDNMGVSASLTIILLWLKLMGAFRILNSAFSLFLYAVHEVMKEVKWFLVFLFLITLMFSDAVRAIAAARGDCQNDVEEMIDWQWQCSDNLFSVIAQMYAVIVGDVKLEAFQSSGAMEAMFVLFTFISIIILLNILIAIVIESYERTKQRSREIFDRARIEYAAHLVARKQFLMPKERTDFYGETYVPPIVRQILFFVFLLGHVCALISAEIGIFGLIYILVSDTSDHYGIIWSIIIAYVCVGAIFNAYILSAGIIALFSMDGSSGPMDQHTCNKIIRLVVRFLKMAMSLFHSFLGFSEDRTVDEGVFTVSEDVLTTRGNK